MRLKPRRALSRSDEDCSALLRDLVASGLLAVMDAPHGPRYRVGPAGLGVLGSEGATAVRRAAEHARHAAAHPAATPGGAEAGA